MAKRIVSCASITPTATADTTDLVDSTYPFMFQGGSSTQRTNIIEIYMGGQAGASAPCIMLLSRDSQLATGSNTRSSSPATQTDVPLDGATAAITNPVVTGNLNATLKPRRDIAAHLLNLSFNAFGGIVRWVAAPGEEVTITGNTASLGEASLSAFSGGTTGLMGAHGIYETF